MRFISVVLSDEKRRESYCLYTVLFSAFVLRFFHLDVPTMWGDELFAPVMATKPLRYLVNWIFAEDVHPPLFYFLLKLNLRLGSSDFALRVVPAALGTVSVWLCYRLGRSWLGREGGLLAGAFLAVSASHLYISRVVRLYSFTVFLTLLALLVLKEFLDKDDRRQLTWFMILTALLLLCEYTSIMPIAALMACMLAVVLSRPGRWKSLWHMVKIGSFCYAVPVAFLVITAINRKGYSGLVSVKDVFFNVARAVNWGLFGTLEKLPSEFMAAVAVFFAILFAAGAAGLWKCDKRLLGICLAFLACPFGVLLVIRPGYSLAFWHIFFLYPVFALLSAAGVQALVRTPAWQAATAAVLSLAAIVLYLGPGYGYLYAPLSYGSDLKEIAKTVAGGMEPGSATILDHNGFDAINWYADTYSLVNRLREQDITPEREHTLLNLFTYEARLAHLVSAEYPISGWAKVIQETPLGITTLVKAIVPRSPIPVLPLTDEPVEIRAKPADFYGKVYSAKDVMINPYWGMHVIPSKNDSWAKVRYRFENREHVERSLITLKVQYRNKGAGNILKAACFFDDEPPMELFASEKVEAPTVNTNSDDPFSEKLLQIRREKTFKRLDVEIFMYCAEITPRFPTSNLDTISLRGVSVAARPLGYDLLDLKTYDPVYTLSGFSGPEQDGAKIWRWAMGPKQTIVFHRDSPGKMKLTYAFNNPFNGQDYTFAVNGEQAGEAKGLPRQSWLREESGKEVVFDAVRGENVLEFSFAKINHVNDSFSETDNSPYAAAFTRLRLEPMGQE